LKTLNVWKGDFFSVAQLNKILYNCFLIFS
jgi:hypothetical protein